MSYKFDKIHLKNYKCFDENGITIDHLESINVIIGKNNSGKSSIIELFKFLTTGDNYFFLNTRNKEIPSVICEHTIKENLIVNSFPSHVTGGEFGDTYLNYGKQFIDSILNYLITEDRNKTFLSVNKNHVVGAKQYFLRYVELLEMPFKGKILSHLSAERDVQRETPNDVLEISTTFYPIFLSIMIF